MTNHNDQIGETPNAGKGIADFFSPARVQFYREFEQLWLCANSAHMSQRDSISFFPVDTVLPVTYRTYHSFMSGETPLTLNLQKIVESFLNLCGACRKPYSSFETFSGWLPDVNMKGKNI